MNKLVFYLIVLSLMLSGCNVIDTSNTKSSGINIKSVVSEKNNMPDNENSSLESKQESIPNDINEPVEQVKGPTIEGIEAFDKYIDTELEPDVVLLYKNLFIGELNKSGFVYIEPFRGFRGAGGTGELKYENYPDTIQFYTIEDESNIYTSIFDSKTNFYIPSIEEGSNYYWQGFEEPNQSTLRYKTSEVKDKALVGITLFNYEIQNIDFSVRGNERIYTENEFNKSLASVKEVNEINGSDEGTLREITLDDTIVGAKQICLFSIKDINIKILLSKYTSVGFESIANIYVVDLIKDGKVIQTFEKINGVAY